MQFSKRQIVSVSDLNIKCDDCGKQIGIQDIPSGISNKPNFCSDCVANRRVAGPPHGSGFRGSRF